MKIITSANASGQFGKPDRLRRRRGATLGLVAVLVLIIAILGIGFFFVARFLGGGRELSNATDAGVVNVAKHALRDPSKDALSFSNPDVGTNFAVYGESPHNLNLLNYNRLVMHAALVAFNARAEGTSQAAQNAKKVWLALNEVAQHIRKTQESAANMGGYFTTMAASNNVKMLGQNRIALRGYDVGFMKRGGSANILLDETVLTAAGASNEIPVNDDGRSSGGKKYVGGYKPFFVSINGETLVFTAVTNGPDDRSHLVTWTDFDKEKTDDFITGRSYPKNTLPPNSYRTGSSSKEMKTSTNAGATAAAIVGTLDRSYPMNMQYGYLIIRNGQSAPSPAGPMGLQGNDVFCHKLAGNGIVTSGNASDDYFCEPVKYEDAKNLQLSGQAAPMNLTETEVANLLNSTDAQAYSNYIDYWAAYNAMKAGRASNFPRGWDPPPHTVVESSLKLIHHADGSAITEADLRRIHKNANTLCRWPDYDDNAPASKDVCKQQINAFKTAYNEFGDKDSSPNITENGWTCLEYFKSTVQQSRVNCTGATTVNAPGIKSGMKWFDHGKKYAAPGEAAYNFGVPKSAYEYLEMIDKVPGGDSCGKSSVIDKVFNRCKEIIPGLSRDSLISALKSKTLPLGATMYLYSGGSGLTLSEQPPSWIVPNTQPDGAASDCGTSYNVIGNLVNASSEPPNGRITGDNANRIDPGTDGLYPGWNYRVSPKAWCADQAIWTPSSGYNHLLGVLDFSNSCSGGGRFCEPN